MPRRDTALFKEIVGQRFGDIIYNGLWYSPLREALQAFIKRTQETVTGEIVLRLYKGSVSPVRRSSPFSLYDKSLATYDEGDQFKHQSAVGFIDIFGLPLRIHAAVAKKNRARKSGR